MAALAGESGGGEQGRVRRWLCDAALPLWSTAGVDAVAGGFVERLTLQGEPDLDASKRVRVQARQIYVFSHAAVMGLHPGASDVAAQGYRFLLDHGCPDGAAAGFVHALRREGQVIDDRRDSYDHAFLIFALSWYYRLSGDPAVARLLRKLTVVLTKLLRHPGGAGFLVDTRGATDLHQNPHMHAFEAFLAAHDATSDSWFLDRAGEMFTLFRTRIFDQTHGLLREYHDAHWRPLAGAAGNIVEPGHQCEWVWLLKRYADLTSAPLCDEAWRLLEFIERHCRRDDSFLLSDQVRPDGRVLKGDTRCWPQTEAIKADIAVAEARNQPLGTRTDEIVNALFQRFLAPAPAGGWIDWTDETGAPLVRTIPASTFYHLFLAFSEYLRARRAG